MPVIPIFCLLFVPGDKPQLFDKAVNTKADVVCLDLEAAVGATSQTQARQAVTTFINSQPKSVRKRLAVRVNALTVDLKRGSEDIKALAKMRESVAYIVLPHTESTAEVDALILGMNQETHHDFETICLVESVHGLNKALEIGSHHKVSNLMLGGVDLTTQLGAKMSYDSLLMPRSSIVHATAHNRIQAIDTPSLNFRDLNALKDDTQRVRDLGFAGKAAIHPDQVDVIRQCFRPSSQEVDYAHAVIEADRKSCGGATQVDGKMIDTPVVEAMRRVVEIEAIFHAEST